MALDTSAIAGSTVIATLITAGGGWYAARQSRTVSDKKVDAEAYERARTIDKEVNETLRAELVRLQVELRETREELAHEEDSRRDVERRLRAVERRLERCIRLLDLHGIAIPVVEPVLEE